LDTEEVISLFGALASASSAAFATMAFSVPCGVAVGAAPGINGESWGAGLKNGGLTKCDHIFPVARRELRSYGYSYSLLNGELRSYQEFPNHILDILKQSKQRR